MTNEEKLEAIYKMTLENHEILKTIRRQQYLSNFGRILYWLVILGALGGTYYYLKPLLSIFTSNPEAIEERMNQFGGAQAITQFMEAMKQAKPQNQ